MDELEMRAGRGTNVLSDFCGGTGDDFMFLAEASRQDWLGKPECALKVLVDHKIAE